MKKKMAFSIVISITVVLALLLAGCAPPAPSPTETLIPKGTVEWHLDQGDKLVDQGRYDEAIEEYTMAIELDPASAEAYKQRGRVYLRLGQFERAIQDCDEAIRLNPQYAKAYNNRGLAYYRLGQFERAIEDYDEAIRLDPEFAIAYCNRGLAYCELGQFEPAIEDYDEAIRLNPQYAVAYYNRGLAYEELGKVDKAIADFEKFITLTDNPEWVAKAKGKIEELSELAVIVKSPYEGTYFGTFFYDYPNLETGERISAQFKLQLTFKHRVTVAGVDTLDVTWVQCDDKRFGTGLAGVTPLPASFGCFPAKPPTAPLSPSEFGMGFAISFPNGAGLNTDMDPGALTVSFEGRKLSNSMGNLGAFWATTPTGPLSEPRVVLLTSFNDWSLTKSAMTLGP